MTLIKIIAEAIAFDVNHATGGPNMPELWENAAKESIKALEEAGFAIVPVEPTSLMLMAAEETCEEGTDFPYRLMRKQYKAMLETAK